MCRCSDSLTSVPTCCMCLASVYRCSVPQIPRLYNLYKEQGIIENFEQLLSNIFTPLFEVTRNPNSHPQLHLFLLGVSWHVLLACTAADICCSCSCIAANSRCCRFLLRHCCGCHKCHFRAAQHSALWP
jgi:hypothetical protein